MSGAVSCLPFGTIATAHGSGLVPIPAAIPLETFDRRPRPIHVAGSRERCANFGDIAARDLSRRAPGDTARGSAVVTSPSFDAARDRASRDASWSRRFVVTAASQPARIVCDHAGLNARTALDRTLRTRVRATALDFLRAPFDRGCVDRNRATSLTPAIDREKFLLAATMSPGGIKHGTVRSNTIPRGRTAGTFPSRARQVVRHSREPDPGGAGTSAEPSRPGFSREGRRSSEDPGSKDQGGPK